MKGILTAMDKDKDRFIGLTERDLRLSIYKMLIEREIQRLVESVRKKDKKA